MKSKSVIVGVGYGWDDDVGGDRRWKTLRTFLVACAKAAESHARGFLSGTSVGSEDEPGDSDAHRGRKKQTEAAPALVLPRVDVRRLRAGVGRFTWASISERILECDVLVFDLTRNKPQPPSESILIVTPNVWIELGFALAVKKHVLAVHSDKDGYKELPSDLCGLMVGHIPEKSLTAAKATREDVSLRMTVTNAIKDCLLAGNES